MKDFIILSRIGFWQLCQHNKWIIYEIQAVNCIMYHMTLENTVSYAPHNALFKIYSL